MTKLFFVLILLLSISLVHAQKIMGFTDAGAAKQLDWEKQFDAQLNGKNQDEWMQFLSSHPHHVGSPQDKTNAEYIANLFHSWGWQAGFPSGCHDAPGCGMTWYGPASSSQSCTIPAASA